MGSRSLLEDNKIASDETNELGTIIHIAKNQEYLGYIVISDKIKDNAKKSLKELKENGIKNIIMLSGDDESVVSEISKKLKIDKSFGNLLPEDKVKILEEYKKNNNVAFVGDGINDVPVIRLADVGIAMGGLGSDATIEA